MQLKEFETYISFARTHLNDLTDKSGTSIYEHGTRVFVNLFNIFSRSGRTIGQSERDILIASLFHDLLEDTKATESDISAISNESVVKLVQELTIDFEGKSIPEAVSGLASVSEAALLIKLSDIYDNCTKSRFLVTKNGIKWYETFFIPLLNAYVDIIDRRVPNAGQYKVEISLFYEDIKQAILLMRQSLQVLS